MSDDRWLVRFGAPARQATSLVCLAHAGGGAHVFARWAASLPAWIDVLGVQLPGRGARLAEPPSRRLPAIITGLGPAVAAQVNAPFALFGHSLGALCAFELAHWLRETGAPLPTALFVSACRAPHRVDQARRLHALPDADLLDELRALAGTPREIIENVELMALLLPVLRADFELVESYAVAPHEPLPCPIYAFVGAGDEIAEVDMRAWRGYTSADFSMTVLPGGHFYLNEEAARATLLRQIARELGNIASAPSTAPAVR